jgi:stage V sporulation protein AA
MIESATPCLYIRLRRKATIAKGQIVYLSDIAQMIAEPEYERKLAKLMIYDPSQKDGNRVLIDMLLIVRTIKQSFPQMQIEHFGEPHVLLEITTETKRPSFIGIALVWLLLFIGSGLAIMNFHVDVSMLEVHQRLYQLITGRVVEHPLLMQIPYSFGIGAGMVIFFNHLFKKKFNEEPSPLEVEMFMYQESMNQFVITEEYNKIHEKKDEL